MRLSPDYKSSAARCDPIVIVVYRCDWLFRRSLWVRKGDSDWRTSSLLGRYTPHKLPNKIIQQIPVIESFLVHNEIVS